jgi:multidrug resistance protein, MATE family
VARPVLATLSLSAPLLDGRSRSRAILRLALPTVVAMLSQSVVNEVDVVFFSHLPCPESSNGQAALLPSLIVVWLFGGSLSAISVGTQALVARRYAENRPEQAGAVLANAAWFCLLVGGLFSLVGLLVLPWILELMIARPEVREVALTYTRWRLFGVISMSMTMGIKAFFDGIGKTHVHLVAAIVMNTLNIFFCWMFIFGHLGAPRMGVPGAGMSAFVATWVGLFIMCLYAALHRERFHPLRWANLSWGLTWDILRLSIPGGAAVVVMMFGFGLFSAVVGRLDATPQAGEAIRVLGQCGATEAVNSAATTDIVEVLKLTFTACLGFGTAAATLVGQSLGAKRPDDAQRFGWASVRLGLVIFGVVGLLEGVLLTEPILAVITQSAAVRAAAIFPMRLMGIVTPIIAVGMILSEALFGAGNPRFVATAQLVLVFGILVPVAYVLGIVLHLGLHGIWMAAGLYFVLAAATMSFKFWQGNWKTIKL